MFYLWVGVMAGILLAYLAMRARSRGETGDLATRAGRRRQRQLKPWWRSWLWLLGGVVALLLLIPVIWEFIRTGFVSFGWVEAIKTILIPWFAGVGFGIWIYLTIGSLPDAQTARQGDAAPKPRQDPPTKDAAPGADAPRVRVAQDAGPEGAPTAVRREFSLIPTAVAILAVMFVVSDAQYGWLARLQKLSFGGSGLEFSPPSTGSQQRVPGPTYGSGDVIGEDRVKALVDFMATLDQMIERDFQYLEELGDATHDNLLDQDKDFANRVVVPLGQHLGIIHEARGYNNLGILINRPLVDAIRSFVHSHRETKPETRAMRQRFAQDVHDKIAGLWRDICETEERVLDLKAIDRKNEELVKKCNMAATEATKAWLSSGFNYALPYGTLLAAMLLNAADELDSAIRDIDEWVADNSPARGRAEQSWLVFRALVQAVPLLAQDSSNTHSYLGFERSKNLMEIGERLLNSTVPSADAKRSWQAQRGRFVKKEPVDLLWELGLCPDDLTASFKRAMLATLQASNSVVYFLSQNIEFAERKNLIREMEWRADYLANKVNTRCLAVSESDIVRVRDLQAAFFDTVATVELTLAAREKQPIEKRRRLCDAYKHASSAIKLQEGTLGTSTTALEAIGPEKSLNRMDFLEGWKKHRKELDALAWWTTYKRRLGEVNNQLTSSGWDC